MNFTHLPRLILPSSILLSVGVGALNANSSSLAQDSHLLHSFERRHLTDVYFSEGAAVGDIDGDGILDVTSGPQWFKGPSFELGGEIRPAVPQDRAGYTDHFFSWVRDFNGDGHGDVLAVGFPGTPGYIYENPGPEGLDEHWQRHTIMDSVANESPQLLQLVGDETPELVCTNAGAFGYATINSEAPFEAWTFHPVSDAVAPRQFGHGLGVGDMDGDGRLDVLAKNGWYAQPADLDGDPRWSFHPASFAPIGGAEIHAYDVDGDGDQDVITSLAAHEFGLAWYEQIQTEGKNAFVQHLIMGSKPEENLYGLHFSELHSVALADVDGDGFKDIVTGKTYYSHHEQSTDWDAGAVVYWFGLQRTAAGSVRWVPHLAAAEAGIGRQIVLDDVNADGKLDIIVGGMKGCSVLLHQTEATSAEGWRAAQPKMRKRD